MLYARYGIVVQMTYLEQDFQDLFRVNNFLFVLKSVPRDIFNFYVANFHIAERRTTTGRLQPLSELLRELELPKVLALFTSETFQNYYEQTVAALVPKMKQRIDAFMESSEPNDIFVFPWNEICPTSRSAYELEKEISITDICSSTQKCSSTQFPYGSSRFDVTDACTSDNKCDLERALPMMVCVYWHALSAFIVKQFCYYSCIRALGGGRCSNFESYERLVEEAKLLMDYTSALPAYFNSVWNVNFLQRAVASNAFSNLDTAMTMIEEKRRDFDRIPHMCHAIKFTKACHYADIYKEFIFIKKVQHYRMNPGLVKDLRLHSRVNHAIMVELQRDTIRHIKILGTIQRLDDNLRASVSGISSYFSSLANYDEGIANADVAFIQGELDKYETATAKVETRLKEEFSTAMDYMLAIALGNFIEQSALLVARIVENCNPVRVIFGGSEAGDIVEQAALVANAASKVVRATTLFISLERLYSDSLLITEAFVGENSDRAQLNHVKSLVDKIRNNQAGDIGVDADNFVEDYAGYTPQTDRSR